MGETHMQSQKVMSLFKIFVRDFKTAYKYLQVQQE